MPGITAGSEGRFTLHTSGQCSISDRHAMGKLFIPCTGAFLKNNCIDLDTLQKTELQESWVFMQCSFCITISNCFPPEAACGNWIGLAGYCYLFLLICIRKRRQAFLLMQLTSEVFRGNRSLESAFLLNAFWKTGEEVEHVMWEEDVMACRVLLSLPFVLSIRRKPEHKFSCSFFLGTPASPWWQVFCLLYSKHNTMSLFWLDQEHHNNPDRLSITVHILWMFSHCVDACIYVSAQRSVLLFCRSGFSLGTAVLVLSRFYGCLNVFFRYDEMLHLDSHVSLICVICGEWALSLWAETNYVGDVRSQRAQPKLMFLAIDAAKLYHFCHLMKKLFQNFLQTVVVQKYLSMVAD